MILVVVHVLRTWVRTCRGWSMDLETVKVHGALDRTSSVCCADLTKVFVDWAMVDSERV
jgi:hypothetical protein